MIGSPNEKNSYQKQKQDVQNLQNQIQLDKVINRNVEEEINSYDGISQKLNNPKKNSEKNDQRINDKCLNIDEDNNMLEEIQNNDNNNRISNYFHSLRNDFYNLRNNAHFVENNIHVLNNDVHNLRNDVHNLSNDAHNLSNDVHNLSNDVHNISNDVHKLSNEVHNLSNDVHEVRNKVNTLFNNINLLFNNIISNEDSNKETSQNKNINYDEILEEKEFDEEATEKDKDEKCAICLENFNIGNKVCYLPCLHVYHSFCIKNWLKIKEKCPLCNNDLSKNNN